MTSCCNQSHTSAGVWLFLFVRKSTTDCWCLISVIRELPAAGLQISTALKTEHLQDEQTNKSTGTGHISQTHCHADDFTGRLCGKTALTPFSLITFIDKEVTQVNKRQPTRWIGLPRILLVSALILKTVLTFLLAWKHTYTLIRCHKSWTAQVNLM